MLRSEGKERVSSNHHRGRMESVVSALPSGHGARDLDHHVVNSDDCNRATMFIGP